ncbi:MAG: metabolite traffic protein EboE [Bacteroidetes bacterium]|nr:metabolite traffic protein EboE [Bacteroidota bacterium]
MDLSTGHLTYCTNIHAGESWPDHFAALQKNFPVIKSAVSPDAPMGIGLRLSNLASLELIKKENIQVFQQWLQENDGYVFTMNGFPYGGFHHTRVKDQVHAPDWTSNKRVDYTIRLFLILKELLPKGMDGGISTSPLSYKPWFSSESERARTMETATKNILTVLETLVQLRLQEDIIMHLDLEPEPDGLMETGQEFIDWYEKHLIPQALIFLANKFALPDADAEKWLKEHICLCYDVCHFAIGYETHQEMIDTLRRKGIKVGKIQISAALKALLATEPAERKAIIETFTNFNEPTYLHQVVARTDKGVLRYKDLPEALSDKDNPKAQEWRAHFHVPIFVEELGLLQTTQADIVEVLGMQKKLGFTNHLETETYTWEVLPDELKLPLNPSIIRELNWVKEQLEK